MKTTMREVENQFTYVNEFGAEIRFSIAVYKETVEHVAFHDQKAGLVQLKVHGICVTRTMTLNGGQEVDKFDFGHLSVTFGEPNCIASELSRMNECSIEKLREYVLNESTTVLEEIQKHANRAYRKQLGAMQKNVALVAKPRGRTKEQNPYILNKGVLA